MSVPSIWLDKTEIVAGLRRLGIAQGSLLEVHTSLRSLGQVDGGDGHRGSPGNGR